QSEACPRVTFNRRLARVGTLRFAHPTSAVARPHVSPIIGLDVVRAVPHVTNPPPVPKSMAVHATLIPPPDLVPVRRALLSVFDKSGLAELAKALAQWGVEIVSTGGTRTA